MRSETRSENPLSRRELRTTTKREAEDCPDWDVGNETGVETTGRDEEVAVEDVCKTSVAEGETTTVLAMQVQ